MVCESSSALNTQLLNASSNRNPRRSWSSIAFNNKNFPDGKLIYESSQNSNENNGNKAFSKNYARFERSGQDVMARASQIVQ